MSEAGPNKQRKVLGWVAKVALSVALLTWLFHKQGTRQAMAHVTPETCAAVALAVVLYAGCQLLNTWKWWLLLRGVGHPVRYWTLARITFIGMFANFFLPTSIGGDVVRVALVAPYGVPVETGALTVLLQRFTGSLALLVIGLVGLLSASAEVEHNLARGLLAAAVVAGVALTTLAVLTFGEQRWGWGARLPRVVGRPVQRLAAALARLAGAPRVLLLVMLASLAFQVSLVTMQGLLGAAVGLRPGAVHWLWLVPLMTMGEMVPLGLAGIGPREAMADTLFRNLGYAPGMGTLTSLLWQAMKILCSLPGGLLLLVPAKAPVEEQP